MNWTAISAAGELIGALGVLLSLLYLAAQIRQNTRALHHASLDQAIQDFSRWRGRLITDPKLIALWRRGLKGQDLDELERAQFDLLADDLVFTAQATFLRQTALQSPPMGIRSIRGLGSVLDHGSGRKWWDRNKEALDPTFVEAIEKQMETRLT